MTQLILYLLCCLHVRTSLLLELTFFQIKKVSLCLVLFCVIPTADNNSLYVTIERSKSLPPLTPLERLVAISDVMHFQVFRFDNRF